MLELINKIPLFEGKGIDETRDLLASINYCIEKYKKGDLVFRIGRPANQVGIILKGHIVVEKNLACGKIMPIFLKYPGQMLGDVAIFSCSDTYPCNAISQGDSQVLLFSKEMLLRMISQDATILSNFLLIYANKLLELNMKIELLSCDSIRQKISFSLLYNLKKHFTGTTVMLPFSKKFWAESMDVSRPSLYRELQNMRSEGLLHLAGKNITILNTNELTNILSQ